MTPWPLQRVTFRFQLSDWVLFTASLPMQVHAERAYAVGDAIERPVPPSVVPPTGSQGYAMRSLPIARELPTLSRVGDYLCYVPLQYPHCYIDLSWSFDQYLAKFSSKSRWTIQRKIRKYSEHCGGSILWKTYSSPEEMPEFFRLARHVSKLTYQERLLEVGLPDTDAFRQAAIALAKDDSLRAFILFDGDRPVSYLYCPAKDAVLIYSYVGYDPEYQSMSVGTVLQWLATEQIFREGRFRYFDFTEGLSGHKQLFATHQRLCANVFFVKRRPVNAVLVYAHCWTERLSKVLGVALDRYGLKARAKRLLRRALPAGLSHP